MNRRSNWRGRVATLIGVVVMMPMLGGCAYAYLVGGMAQNLEYQKQVQTYAKYDGLEGKTVGVVVDVDMTTLYEHPQLVAQITGGITARIGAHVKDTKVVLPARILEWQWRTPQWNALPYGDLAEVLNVDRVVYIDIYEYRLHPAGNQWLWEGVCAANVSVIDRDATDPDALVDTFDVVGRFPKINGVSRDQASDIQIETGVLHEFVKHATWLFYEHLEPKYPDKFRPEAQAKK